MGTVSVAKEETSSTSQKSKLLMKKLRQQKNEEAVGLFFVGILGIVCLYAIFFWIRTLHRRSQTQRSAFRKPIMIIRIIRRKLLVKVPGFVSAGHVVVFILYVIVSLVVLFPNINWINLSAFAKRLGWLTVLNLCLTVFLGLKKTPLALLTNQSYEKLNCLHQVAGYSCITCFLLHAIVYIANLNKSGKLSTLEENVQIMGMIAGLGLLVIFFTATFLRKHYYETFYAIHIIMAVIVLIMAGLHRPRLSKTKSSFILLFTGVIWGLDRILRLGKYLINSYKNIATITPLPHGGTRVVLSKSLKSAVPGQYFLIWLPGIRPIETHPFTCISTNPLEFIISAQNGFTRSLNDRAVKEPGAKLKASVDGPYGIIPDLTAFNKVLFIAGGSGASFTCGLAVDLVRKLGRSTKTSIDFTLVLKYKETTEWISKYLDTLASSSIVTLNIHVTRNQSEESSLYTYISLRSDTFHSSDLEKSIITPFTSKTTSSFSQSNSFKITQSPTITQSQTNVPIVLNLNRPDISSIISHAVNTASTMDRIAVAACGPSSMMLEVRKTVVDNIHPEGPGLDLFSENFGW